MRKRVLSVCLIIILLVALSCTLFACKDEGVYDENLLSNSDFELTNEASSVTGWLASDSSKVSYPANVKDDAYDINLGKRYLNISETSGGYVYIYQDVKLEKNATYKISAYINATSVVENNAIGVRLAFDTEVPFKGLNITEKTEGFQNFECYFNSAVDKTVRFVVGIGSKTTQPSAEVKIDNIRLEKVHSIPASYLEDHKEIEVLRLTQNTSMQSSGSVVFVVLMTLASIVVFVVIMLLIQNSKKSYMRMDVVLDNSTTKDKILNALKSPFAGFVYVILGAFAIRFLILVLSFGMTSNVTALENYTIFVQAKGLLSVYFNDASLTMPMGGTLIYSLLGSLAKAMNIKTASLGYSILMRMPLIISELVTVYVIYAFTSKHKDEKQAAIYSSLYAFVPLFFFAGAFGAQTDVLATTLLIVCMLKLLDKDYILTSLFYLFALMFSHYALVILPVILIFEVYGIIYDEKQRWTIAFTMLASFIIFFLVGMVLDFESFKEGKVFECFKRIYQFYKENASLTKDSFNIYAVFGANVVKTRTTMVEVMNWLFVVAMSLAPGYIYFKNKNRTDLVLAAGLMYVLFATFGACSTINILPIGIALLVLYFVIIQDSRLFAAIASLATLSFLNIAMLASQSGYISQIEGAVYKSFAQKDVALIIFSIFTVLAAIYLTFVAVDIAHANQLKEIRYFEKSTIEELKDTFSGSLKKKENKGK